MLIRLYSLLLLFLVFFPILSFYPQEKKIVIFAETDSLPSNSKVYITGGNDELGNWYNMQKMKKRSFNSWSYKIYAKPVTRFFSNLQEVTGVLKQLIQTV